MPMMDLEAVIDMLLYGDDVNTFPRQKKPLEGSTKRSASENNMNGQLHGKPFFTKNADELKGDMGRTTLVKSVRGLGFTIVGGNQRDTQFLQIKNVVENGPAFQSGKLKTGDVIVRVNSTCVLGYTHQDVVRLFQAIAPGDTVELETCRGYPLNFDPDDPNTEIVTTVAVTLPQNANTSNTPTSSAVMLNRNGMGGSSSHLSPAVTNHSHVGLKPLPDLALGLNSTSSLSPSTSQEEGGMGLMGHDDSGSAVPDLVSLSIHSKPEFLSIGIVKGPMGFGFTIADSPYGQRVKHILDQGRCKNLLEGDLLIQINSINIRPLPHQDTVQVLMDCPQGDETEILVQRGGIPPPGKGKKHIKPSRSFDERPALDSSGGSGVIPPGSYFFSGQQNHYSPDKQLAKGDSVAEQRDDDNDNIDDAADDDDDDGGEDFEEGGVDDVEGSRGRSKTPSHSESTGKPPQRPKTPSDTSTSRSKTPTRMDMSRMSGGAPKQQQQSYENMQMGRREAAEVLSLSSNSNHSRSDAPAVDGRPPPGPANRPDFLPRYDPRFRGGDPFQRSYSSTNAYPIQTNGDDRWGYGREAKPGQFRSRTPGPELMTRGGPGPDYGGRPEFQRPKTPTAADMRSNGKPPGMGSSSYGTSEFRTSGRFTPNPSSEQGRQYRLPFQDYGRNWPDFSSPPPQRRYEPFENALNRSYTSDFSRAAFPSSMGPGRPTGSRQSTSFESENPAPSTLTKLPRRPAPPQPTPSFLGHNALSPVRGMTPVGEGTQVVEMDVTLHRQESGYGFRIIGGTEDGSQVSVGHIVPGGAADMDGRLRQYDEITHVDGCSVLRASHHRVVELMTNAALNGRVTLTIRRVMGSESNLSQTGLQYPYDVVVSRRENEGFGFVIISSVNKTGASVDEFIGHIQPNSPAERCGRLHVGDRILAVNSVDTSHMHHKDVVSLIKDSGFSVALTIGPPPDDSSNSSQKSQGSSMNPLTYPPELINSWERTQGPLGRPRATSNQGSDDSGELYQVELFRGSRGFGFSIRGGREFNAMPLFVLRIADGGAADMDGRLRVGDQILEINAFVTDNMTHTEAIEIIQNGGTSVRLLMRHTNKPPPVFDGPPASPSGLFAPNIPATSNGPIGHSSPHMARRFDQQAGGDFSQQQHIRTYNNKY